LEDRIFSVCDWIVFVKIIGNIFQLLLCIISEKATSRVDKIAESRHKLWTKLSLVIIKSKSIADAIIFFDGEGETGDNKK
jgi:hypothetical protein